uniref:Uncharacterized protein n=1 Tax=Ditylenchus dipsaci TaxID=166011 RepID=A0A915CXS2_9BILA
MSSSILSIDLEDMEVETKPNLSMQIQHEQNKITEKDENLQHKLVEVETKLRQLEDKNVDLRAQLLAATEKKKSESKRFSKDNPASNDVKQMYDQLKYKDNRIIDLNNLILEKERRIMDLQEAYREQGQVAQSKQQAVQIVNRRLQELDGREVRHVSTEVDPSLFSDRSSRKSTRNQAINNATQSYNRKNDRNESPEELFRNLKCLVSQIHLSTSGSPPPIDPSEDMSSYTTETLNMGSMQADRLDESSFEADLIAPLNISPGMSPKQLRKYHRKRVTFDLHQLPNKKKTSSARKSPPVDIKSDVDDLQPLTKSRMAPNNTEDYDYADLVVENDQLRKIIAEMERNASSVKTVESKSENIKELEKVIQQSQHDTKIQVLKARASTQARVKELETALASIRSSSSKEIETLKAINETLKTSREWTLNENGHLLKKISDMKTKLDDLHGELDASVNTNTMFRNRLEEEEKRLEAITQELIQSRRHAQQVADENRFCKMKLSVLKKLYLLRMSLSAC